MYRDLTKGNIAKGLLLFALPMIAGNLLQQFYNIADTLIVGQALGKNALAAVGSAYTLMTFLTSIFLGLSMGAGALFSIYLGKKDYASLRSAVYHALILIFAVTAALNILVYAFLDPILRFLQIPAELFPVRLHNAVMIRQTHQAVLAANISVRTNRLSQRRQIIPVLYELLADRLIRHLSAL